MWAEHVGSGEMVTWEAQCIALDSLPPHLCPGQVWPRGSHCHHLATIVAADGTWSQSWPPGMNRRHAINMRWVGRQTDRKLGG